MRARMVSANLSATESTREQAKARLKAVRAWLKAVKARLKAGESRRTHGESTVKARVKAQ